MRVGKKTCHGSGVGGHRLVGGPKRDMGVRKKIEGVGKGIEAVRGQTRKGQPRRLARAGEGGQKKDIGGQKKGCPLPGCASASRSNPQGIRFRTFVLSLECS